MPSAGKVVVRIVFVVFVIIVLTSDYSEFLSQLLGGNRTEPGSSRSSPRPTNPGYGDVKTEIDLDADIEEDHIRNIGWFGTFYKRRYFDVNEVKYKISTVFTNNILINHCSCFTLD